MLMPTDRLWLLHRFTGWLGESTGHLGRHLCPEDDSCSRHQFGRQREIFPLTGLF